MEGPEYPVMETQIKTKKRTWRCMGDDCRAEGRDRHRLCKNLYRFYRES